MSSVPCTNCGAEILAGAKFCRKCGKPSLDAGSISEATTRVFGTAERSGGPTTTTWNAQPTGPAYMQPGEASPLNAPATTSLASPAQPGTPSRIPVLVLALIVFALLSLGAGLWFRNRSVRVTRTMPPPVAGAPTSGIPPLPPPPPTFAEPPAAGTSVPTSELMYPGAETTLEVRRDNSHTLGLRTADPTDKVVDWYVSKLNPTERIISGASDAVLRAGTTTVIISGRSGKTDVIIKQGAGQ